MGLNPMSSSDNTSASAGSLPILSTALAAVALVAPVLGWGLLHTDAGELSQSTLVVSTVAQMMLLATKVRARTRRIWRARNAASVLYYEQIETRLLRAGVVVSLVSVAACVVDLTSAFPVPQALSRLATVPVFLFALGAIRLRLLRVSVANGTFGTNRTEARELINFILRNEDKFKGAGGGGVPLISETHASSPASGVEATRKRALPNVVAST